MKSLPVPVFQQEHLQCGPTALRMVLKYFGTDMSAAEIIRQIGGVKRYGVRTVALAKFATHIGFRVHCYSYNPKMSKGLAEIRKPAKEDILRFLRKNLPVILSVRAFLILNEPPSQMGHFVVITGYEKGVITYNDPFDGKRHEIAEADLLFAWHNNILDSSAYLLVLEPKG